MQLIGSLQARVMTVTCAMLLASVRLSKKKVSELKEEEAVLRTEAASPGQPSHLAAPMLEEAECLQDAAHRELLKANCMEKLFHGELLRCCSHVQNCWRFARDCHVDSYVVWGVRCLSC